MPPGGQDRGAAQTGAADSVSTELLNVTGLCRALPLLPSELKAERRTRRDDFGFFAKHPHRKSYVRKYHPGELPALIVATQRKPGPSHVAVGYVCPGERVRVFIWPGHDHREACRVAEQRAELERVALQGTP